MTTTQSSIAAAATAAGWTILGKGKYSGFRKAGRSINIEWSPRGGAMIVVVDGEIMRGANKADRVIAAMAV